MMNCSTEQSELIDEALQLARDFKESMKNIKHEMFEVGPNRKELAHVLGEVGIQWDSFQGNLNEVGHRFEWHSGLTCWMDHPTFKAARQGAWEIANIQHAKVRGFAECLIWQIEEED